VTSKSKFKKRKRDKKWCELHQTNGPMIPSNARMWESAEPKMNKGRLYKKDDKTKEKKELMAVVKEGIHS
jgi:hypothetical protein